MGKLDDKVTIISGSGPGFGQTVAELFTKEGSKIIAVDINKDFAINTAKRVKELGGESVYAVADIAELNQVKDAVDKAVKAFGKIDILFNNAGLQGFKYFSNILDIDPVNAHRAIDVNFKGTFNFIYEVAPIMKENGGGSIVSLASAAGFKAGSCCYGPTKGAVISLSRGVAYDLGEYNIRSNTVSPYTVATPFISSVIDEKFMKVFEEDSPMRRLVDVNDVANAVLFLASDESKSITGLDMRVDCAACYRLPISEDDFVKNNPY